MIDLVKKFKEKLDSMSDKELDKLIEKIKPYSETYPTVDEYLDFVKNVNDSIYNEENI